MVLVDPSAGDAPPTATVASPAAPAPNQLQQRIAALEALAHGEAEGARPPLVLPLVRRLKLLERMIDRLDIDAARSPLVEGVLRAVESSCLACSQAARCGHWLEGDHPDHANREFCPNAGLLELLPRRETEVAHVD